MLGFLFVTSKTITSQELNEKKHFKHKYFVYVEDFENNKINLKNDLMKYKEIIVIIRINGSPKNSKKPYSFYTLNKDIQKSPKLCLNIATNIFHISPSILLQEIVSLNSNAKYTILVTACFGFYMHEYSYLLPKNSILITLSDDYTSSTLPSIFFYIYYKKTNIKHNIFLMLYQYFQSTMFCQIPHVFFTYKDKYNTLKGISLFDVTNYYINPFFNVTNLSEIKTIKQKHYICKPKEIQSYILNRKIQKCNPYMYNSPHKITKTLNYLYKNPKYLPIFFDNLYTKNFKHLIILNCIPKCKIEIIHFLKIIANMHDNSNSINFITLWRKSKHIFKTKAIKFNSFNYYSSKFENCRDKYDLFDEYELFTILQQKNVLFIKL